MPKKKNAPYVGIDLGGTKILAAVVSPKGKVLGQAKRPTAARDGPEAVFGRIEDATRRALDKADVKLEDVAAVGIGAPGVVDKGIVRFAPNLRWEDVALGQALRKRLDRPIVVGNDVDVATYGEYALGVGAGHHSVVGIFPGTGIGGAVILDGKLHTGARGSTNEIGHMVIDADGPLCPCGRRGCAEAVASRTAIDRDLRNAMRWGRETMLTKMVGKGELIRSGTLARAARAGDPLVLETLLRTGRYLGMLAGTLVNLLDPEIMIFGGGLIEACAEWLMPTIRDVARQHFINRLDIDAVKFEIATLGDLAGVLGAAMLARNTFS